MTIATPHAKSKTQPRTLTGVAPHEVPDPTFGRGGGHPLGTASEDVDLWTPVAQQVGLPVAIEIETKAYPGPVSTG